MGSQEPMEPMPTEPLPCKSIISLIMNHAIKLFDRKIKDQGFLKHTFVLLVKSVLTWLEMTCINGIKELLMFIKFRGVAGNFN